MVSVATNSVQIRRTVGLRPQGAPCYGASCGCHCCLSQKGPLATVSGIREEGTRLRFRSRLRFMENLMKASLLLLCIRLFHLHRQAPEISFEDMPATKAGISQLPEPSPAGWLPLDGVMSRPCDLRPIPACSFGDYQLPGNHVSWSLLLGQPPESWVASKPINLQPMRTSIRQDLLPIWNPMSIDPRWPVAQWGETR